MITKMNFDIELKWNFVDEAENNHQLIAQGFVGRYMIKPELYTVKDNHFSTRYVLFNENFEEEERCDNIYDAMKTANEHEASFIKDYISYAFGRTFEKKLENYVKKIEIIK